MKKILLFFMVALLAIVFVGCDDPKPEYTFEVEAEATTVKVGESININASTNKPDPIFGWTSSDDSIATVDQDGKVTGVKAGDVTITVTLEGNDDKEVEITVLEKDLTPDDLKTILTAVLSEYTAAKNGAIKLTSSINTVEEISETIFNYKADGSIDSLMYKGVTKEDGQISIYVKDGYSYMSTNGTKSKKALTAQDVTTIKSKYGQSEFLKDFTKFYSENEFYAALEYSNKTDNTTEFLLDLTKYTGNILVTEGVDEIKVLTTIVEGKVTKVEILSKQGSTTVSVKAEYLGTGVQTITYPSDLETYPG